MAIFIPKWKYLKENKDYISKLSRIPLGTLYLEPYKINGLKKLQKDLNEVMSEIIKSPESIDGQNGDILDNYISNWENRAKANLNRQRALRANSIMVNSSIRAANLKNAKDWIIEDLTELNRINNELQIKEKEFEEQKKNYKNW